MAITKNIFAIFYLLKVEIILTSIYKLEIHSKSSPVKVINDLTETI